MKNVCTRLKNKNTRKLTDTKGQVCMKGETNSETKSEDKIKNIESLYKATTYMANYLCINAVVSKI